MIEDLPDYPALQAIQDALWHVSDVRGAAVMVGSGFSTNAELATPVSKAPPLWSQMAAAMERQLGPGSSGAQNPLRLAEESSIAGPGRSRCADQRYGAGHYMDPRKIGRASCRERE